MTQNTIFGEDNWTTKKLHFNPITINNIKVFDKNNPNITILNTDEEIVNMLKDKPIILDDLPLDYDIIKLNKTEVIGIIKEITKIDSGEFYGTIWLYDKKYENYIFKNYEVSIKYDLEDRDENDNRYIIESILGIEFGDSLNG